MRFLFVSCLSISLAGGFCPHNSQADDALAEAIRKIDGTVASPDEKESVASQVRDDLRARMQRANEKSSAEWQAVRTCDDWERLRSEKLAAMRKGLGTWPEPPAELRTEATGEVVGNGFRIRNTLFESRPGWWVSANLYVPEPVRESMPGIVICHAHHTPKPHGELQDMGMTWARAGCYVLVLDQVGHGERRQHPFETAVDYSKPYGVSRQDYYFRYDSGFQLQLIGESLAGWMAWDVMRCADLLLKQKGIDPQRLILLGSVAGGGDPAAVAGALDDRFAAVVPFNFGGPQPETRFPLPDDIEKSFQYAGSGGWESTRNLLRSANGGFLPWMIVAGIAPRRLVYGHEFNWDQQRDPVWKRLQTVYRLYEHPDHLAFTHGRGELKDQPPVATHCTHIGPPHRVRIHEAFAKWFGIEVTPETEYSERVPSERLRCWTPETRQKYQPKSLATITTELANQRIAQIRHQTMNADFEFRRRESQTRWEDVLGPVAPERLQSVREGDSNSVDGFRIQRWMLTSESGIRIPCLLLEPEQTDRDKPVVLAICSQGKNRLLKDRASDIAGLLKKGATVCLIDPRGLGESKLGDSHTRRSSATSHSSTALMLGRPLLGEQLRDVRMVLTWLRRRQNVGFRPLAIWGESLTPANPETAPFRTPRDDDQALPAVSEPQAPLLAILAGVFEEDLDSIYTVGCLVSWRSLLSSHLVLTAHDVLVPGALTTGEVSDMISVLPKETRLRMEASVDGWNRIATGDLLHSLREAHPSLSLDSERHGPIGLVLSSE